MADPDSDRDRGRGRESGGVVVRGRGPHKGGGPCRMEGRGELLHVKGAAPGVLAQPALQARRPSEGSDRLPALRGLWGRGDRPVVGEARRGADAEGCVRRLESRLVPRLHSGDPGGGREDRAGGGLRLSVLRVKVVEREAPRGGEVGPPHPRGQGLRGKERQGVVRG